MICEFCIFSLSKFASISIGRSVFIVGGESFKPEYTLVKTIAKFSFTNSRLPSAIDNWSKIGELYHARSFHSVGLYLNKLLVVGKRIIQNF